jgi:hypothetical protein
MVVLRDQVVETAGLVEAVQEVTVQEAVDSADLVVVISEARDQAEVVEIETETGGAEVLTEAREIEMVVLIVAQVQIDQDIEVVNTILF